MIFEGFKHLNVHLILVQKFSNFIVSLNKTVEIFINLLKITQLIISPIFIFHIV